MDVFGLCTLTLWIGGGFGQDLFPLHPEATPADVPEHSPTVAQDFAKSTITCPRDCACGGSELSLTLSVKCTRMNLTDLPGDLSHRTVYLDLSNNIINQFADFSFSPFTFLDELKLTGNQLSDLPPNLFTGLISLRLLYIEHNQLATFPDAVKRLQYLALLYLDHNYISDVPADSFNVSRSLVQLYLHSNRLAEVPVEALYPLTDLERLTLAENEIRDIPNGAFRNLSKLEVLIVFKNHIRSIGPKAFEGLTSLKILELDGNEIEAVPDSISMLTNLERLTLSHNRITYLADNCFSHNKKLSFLRINNNPLASFGTFAFTNLPYLQGLMLSEVHDQREFPDLTGNINLETLELDRSKISRVPDDFCSKLPKLVRFDIHSNKISELPNFDGCNELITLNLGNNDLTSLGGQMFSSLKKLQDLTLFSNKITYIPSDAFVGLENLQYLDLQHNNIKGIHQEAFVPIGNLEDLNVGENAFSVLPTKGLENIKNLKTFGNRELTDFPHPDNFPKIHILTLSYAYHCCEFIAAEETETVRMSEMSEIIEWLDRSIDESEFSNLTDISIDTEPMDPDWYDAYGEEYDFNYSLPDLLNDNLQGDYSPRYTNTEDMELAPRPPVDCSPMPGPFMPCDDLMGWWSLRCGVWVVFLLAVLGNGTVLFVSISGRSKMDVPRFLICNLACADFCMGVYLGFLAIVDASTLGVFKKYAIKWQTSPGCMVAGFLGVFSSELSVFTLTIITLERFYAITHAMHLNKRMSLRNAGYIMCCGWIFAIILATMPQYGISDFSKFAICLPFEIGDSISLGYVCFIMLTNCIAFLIIVSCYTKMYCSIRGSQAWNSNDSRVAKRMALLVFTDFACWAPISFFSLTAAFGHELISLNDAKVFAIFVLPLNSCANPFLYAIFTKQFKKDCSVLCKRLEESAIHLNLSKASNRNVSLSWGSSRRPSALNSFFNNPALSTDDRNSPPTGHHPRPVAKTPSHVTPQGPLARLTRMLSCRRAQSHQSVPRPMELSSYDSRSHSRQGQTDTGLQVSDVFGHSEISSSAVSAPPDTGHRRPLVSNQSKKSSLKFWKRWSGTKRRNMLPKEHSYPGRRTHLPEPSSSAESNIPASTSGNIDSTMAATRAPRKYNSPYGSGRRKLRSHPRTRQQRRRLCITTANKSTTNGCCCASGRSNKGSLDLESPNDYHDPHPSITDDSSGEIMSSGFSENLSSSDQGSDDDEAFLGSVSCGILIEPTLDADVGIKDEPNRNNNHHEYVNIHDDVIGYSDQSQPFVTDAECPDVDYKPGPHCAVTLPNGFHSDDSTNSDSDNSIITDCGKGARKKKTDYITKTHQQNNSRHEREFDTKKSAESAPLLAESNVNPRVKSFEMGSNSTRGKGQRPLMRKTRSWEVDNHTEEYCLATGTHPDVSSLN